MNISNLVNIIKGLSTEEVTNLLNNLSDYEPLHQILSSLSKEKRESILNKITLFTESDAKTDNLNGKGHYDPEIRKLDFVHVNFTGVGGEWDGGHYGVVWNVNPKFDSFVVIPTTSQPREEYADVFPIGRVLGLPKKDTTLLVSDMTRVSRKRIEPVTFEHFTKGKITSRLKSLYITRIEEAIAVTYGGQSTFFRFLHEKTSVAMPDDLSPLYAWRFRPIVGRYDEKNMVFYYRLWRNDIWNMLKMVNPKEAIYKENKQMILNNLFSPDDNLRKQAESDYKRLYK